MEHCLVVSLKCVKTIDFTGFSIIPPNTFV